MRKQLILARTLVPIFTGWNEKENGNAERRRQERIRQENFYKDEKKKLIERGIL